MIPTANDIERAIKASETGDWIDTGVEDADLYWRCVAYDPEGDRHCDGVATTPEMAAALAWVGGWAPDALHEAHVPPGSVPLAVPEGWRFELTPPAGPKRTQAGHLRVAGLLQQKEESGPSRGWSQEDLVV